MSTPLLEIQPQELKFVFELKKQSSCSVHLINKSSYHVAFKVKTTCPKKYCVRPNTGVIQPKSTCDFTVTMQAQKVSPPDMICKDKFLIQSTVVPAGTTEEDITAVTFTKDDGKRIDEKKLRVILASPPHSPVPSPINGTREQVTNFVAIAQKDHILERFEKGSEVQNLEAIPLIDHILDKLEKPTLLPKVVEEFDESAMENIEVFEPMKGAEYRSKNNAFVIEEVNKSEFENSEVELDAEDRSKQDSEDLIFVKDIVEMRSKLFDLESKLHKAEVTISKLTNERRLTAQESKNLCHELELLKNKRFNNRKVQVGFPALFVCMVALVSLFLGYRLHP